MPRPNVVLVTIECWRADHFGLLTPNLVRLAEEAVFFSEAQSSGGWTKISMTALMSGDYASMHGGPGIALTTPARRTLAECLLEGGYWTGGFTANLVCGTAAGFHRGFASFRDVQRKGSLPPGAPTDAKTEWPRLLAMGIAPRQTQTSVDAHELTDIGLRWLEDRNSKEPFFLWLHYLDPHWPCQMAPGVLTSEELRDAWNDIDVFRSQVLPSRGRFDPGSEMRLRWPRRYRDCVSATDSEIGRLLDGLRGRPDWDRTIVAITGDHGEEFFERGTWHHSWNQLHREGIHVPLILRLPETDPRVIAEPVGLIDLSPTLLDLVGINRAPAMRGRSLRSLLEGHARGNVPVSSEMLGHIDSASYRLAIRDGEWKYIYDFEDPHNSKLFRVTDDPGETINLRNTQAGVFRRFEELRLSHVTLGLTSLMQRQRAFPQGTEARSAEEGRSEHSPVHAASAIDPVLREQMEALGYL